MAGRVAGKVAFITMANELAAHGIRVNTVHPTGSSSPSMRAPRSGERAG